LDKDVKQTIDELNRFLRGRYMGLHQYEQLILRTKDPELKEMLQKFQHHAKLGATKVANRIRELGGEPVDGAGILGEIRLWWQKLQDKSDNIVDILHDAYVGENRYGIHMSHEMVSGDIDETSAKLIDEILEEDQMRVDQIKQRLRLVGVDV